MWENLGYFGNKRITKSILPTIESEQKNIQIGSIQTVHGGDNDCEKLILISMSQFIELQRSKLEECDIIRQETFKRFRKNPSIIPPKIREKDDILGVKDLPFKLSAMQKHEVKYFSEKYNNHINSLKNIDSSVTVESINKLNDPDANFSYFDTMLDQLSSLSHYSQYNPMSTYAMYSQSPMGEVKSTKKGKLRVKRKYLLSEEASTINFDGLFSDEEHYGQYIDVRKFHHIYTLFPGKKDVTYIEYLKIFDKPFDGAKPNDYKQYIEELMEYITGFIRRRDPLVDFDISSIEKTYKPPDDGSVKDGMVYCKACDHTFKETVYKGHIDGKKHKKNQARVSSTSSTDYYEFMVLQLSNLIRPVIEETIGNVERHEGMTDREKMIEHSEMVEDEEAYTTADSDPSEGSDDSSDDEDRGLFKDLPLGVDGTPIPFWLYKLQGLHHNYECEVCGNVSYKGRLTFEKHFSSVKHQRGLKYLGVESSYMNLFGNITKIEEVQNLWDTLRRQARAKEGEIGDAVEVEDEEGNVMTQKDYIQLKKQGLI